MEFLYNKRNEHRLFEAFIKFRKRCFDILCNVLVYNTFESTSCRCRNLTHLKEVIFLQCSNHLIDFKSKD